MDSEYFRGKNEIRNKIIETLKEDYKTLNSLNERPLFNKIKIIKITERIRTKEEILGLNKQTKIIYETIGTREKNERKCEVC